MTQPPLPSTPGRSLSSKPTAQPFWAPLFALWVISFAGALAMAPLVDIVASDQGAALAGTLRTGIWVLAAMSPVLALLKGTLLAGAAWGVLTLMGSDVPFRGTFASILLGEVIMAVQGLWVAGILRLRGPEAASGPGGLDVTTGLDILFPDPTTALGALAVTVTPFHAAWVLFLAWRFTAQAHGNHIRGGAAALVCWLLVTSVGVLATGGQ